MNELDRIRKRLNKRRGKKLTDHHFAKLYNAMMKLMVAMIVSLAILSYVKVSPNGSYIRDYILNNDYYENVSLWISQHLFLNNDVVASTNVSYTHIEDNYYTNATNEVLNFLDGRVIYVGNQDLLGNYVTVLLENGVEVTYGQINDVFVDLFDSVEASTILGTYNDQLILIFTKDGNEIDYTTFVDLLS